MARILLVEDDPDNIGLLKRLLEHHGYEIVTAECASEGIVLARSVHPHVILMDLELPDEPDGQPDPNAGLDATRKLKADDSTRHIPVIALTAHTMAQHKERIESAGCDDLQEKPIFPFDSLLEKISAHLPE